MTIDLCDTTQRLSALEVTDEAISTRIKNKSREMRAFHQKLRKTISDETDPPAAIQDLAKVAESG